MCIQLLSNALKHGTQEICFSESAKNYDKIKIVEVISKEVQIPAKAEGNKHLVIEDDSLKQLRDKYRCIGG